jgi:hypothetical protein
MECLAAYPKIRSILSVQGLNCRSILPSAGRRATISHNWPKTVKPAVWMQHYFETGVWNHRRP